eukprot:jgi/Ulvmu1/5495/UM023_0031.1
MSLPPKRKRQSSLERDTAENDEDISTFLSAWAWKREHLPDKLRFRKPYKYPLDAHLHQSNASQVVTIHQQSFKAEGFASTVWDSSILVSKYIESNVSLVAGQKVCDVSAGTGLVGIVASLAGAAQVVATDLQENLPLLQRNIQANGLQRSIAAAPLQWGTDDVRQLPLPLPFDLAIACDVMYIVEAVGPLVATLAALIGRRGRALVAHGRNCCAEDAFRAAAAAAGLTVTTVPPAELHPRYRAQDITVLLLRQQSSNATQHAAQQAESGGGGDAVARRGADCLPSADQQGE